MPRVLLINPHDTSVEYLDDREVAIDLLQTPDRITELQRARADRVRLVDNFDDMGQVLAAARALHIAARFDGIVAFHEPALELAARLSASLAVSGNPLSAVRTARDKGATRQVLGTGGLRNPRYAVARTSGELAAAIRRIGYPSVAKPVDGAGSAGVRVLRNADDLAGLSAPSADAPLIVESFVRGRELSVETLSRDGRHDLVMVTEKLVSSGRFPVELGHQIPARLSPALHEWLGLAVRRLLRRLGHQVGPAHTEVCVTEHGIYLIETHTRYGGDRIWEMTGLVTGRYPQPDTVAALTRRPAPRRVPAARAAAIRFVTASPGRLTHVDGVASARAVPGVVRVAIDAVPGEMIQQLASSSDRLGYVLALGDTIRDATHAACQALAQIRVGTE